MRRFVYVLPVLVLLLVFAQLAVAWVLWDWGWVSDIPDWPWGIRASAGFAFFAAWIGGVEYLWELDERILGRGD